MTDERDLAGALDTAVRGRESFVLVFLLIASGFFTAIVLFPDNASAMTLYVGGSGPSNYTTIQEAIGAASPGDTIFVYNGTYYEYITVNKRLSLVGENKNTTIIHNTAITTTVTVTASWVNISGFTLTTDYWNYALGFNSINNVTIADNIITNHWGGVGCYLSNDTTFKGNRITTTTYDGISVGSSLRVRLLGNVLTNTGISVSGDTLEQWDTHTIDTSNTVNGKPVYYWRGVTGGTIPNGAGEVIIANSTGVTVGGQDFAGGGPGVLMGFSSDNFITYNVISSKTGSSVSLTHSSNNTIAKNWISGGSGFGLVLDHSDGNNIENNTLMNNAGVSLSYSHNNVVLTNSLSTNLTSGAQSTGIGLYRSLRNVIGNNTISSVHYSASINLDLSQRNKIANNTLTSGQTGAIGVSNHSDYTNLTRNKLWQSHIDVSSSSNNAVTYNEVQEKYEGIGFTDSNDNIVMYNPSNISLSGSRNMISFNTGNVVASGSGNLISNNTGCISLGGSYNRAINNTAVGCSYGVVLAGVDTTTNNTVAGNVITNAGTGVEMYWTGPGNIVADNQISGSRWGILVNASSGQTIVNNTFSNNQDGIIIRWLSTNTIIIGNRISNNIRGLEFVLSSSGNTIYHNDFVGNTLQADDNFTNTWDNGYPSGGNYWSDYTGVDVMSGAGQDQPGSDGIGDTPKPIPNGNNRDRYPLMTPGAPGPVPPSAPRILQATAGDGQVALSWLPPALDGGSPVTNYRIYRGTFASGETFLVEIGNALTYTDVSVTNGQIYYYVASAKNAAGEGPHSNEANATPKAGPTVPGPPAGLTATGGSAQISLTWSRPASNGGSSVTNYRIYKGTASGGETYLAEIGNVTSYTDGGLGSGQKFFYTVSARNAIGEGPKSNEASATTWSAPGQPTGLVAIAGDKYVSLAWSPPSSNGGSNITNYRLYRGTLPGGEAFLTELGNVFTYADSGLVNGQTYYYRISAKNAFGEGPQSPETSAIPSGRPGIPPGLATMAGDGQVSLAWSAPADNGGSAITNYMIYRGSFSGGESFLVQIGNVLSYVDMSVTNGLTYYYRVSAVNSVGEGPLSSEAYATPSSGLTVPTEPRSLSATPGDSQVTLTWLPPSSNGGSPITNYFIYRGTVSGGEALLVEIGVVLTYTDVGTANGQRYYYTVSAKNSVGEGPKSNEAWATPSSGAGVPSAPQDAQAGAGNAQVTLTWNPPSSDGGSPVANYRIYRGGASGGETLFVEIGNVSSFIDANVANGRTYYYRITAKNAAGEGPMSNEVSATPSAQSRNLPPICGIISPTSNSAISGTYVIAGIALDPDGTVQKVEVRIDDGPWIEASGNTSWTYEWDTSIVSNGRHAIHARSYDGTNYSTESNVTIIVDNAAVSENKAASIYQLAFWAVLALAIIETVLLLALLLRGRRGRKPEESRTSQADRAETSEEGDAEDDIKT